MEAQPRPIPRPLAAGARRFAAAAACLVLSWVACAAADRGTAGETTWCEPRLLPPGNALPEDGARPAEGDWASPMFLRFPSVPPDSWTFFDRPVNEIHVLTPSPEVPPSTVLLAAVDEEPLLAPVPEAPDAGGPVAEAKTLGREPEDYSLEFLRRETVLLKPGQWQFDAGIAYTLTDTEVPVFLAADSVVRGRIRQRLLVAPFEFRFGLAERMQAFLRVPVGWSNTELSYLGDDDFSNTGGIGDLRGGLSLLLWRGGHHGPDVVGTFAFTAPTGNADFPLLSTSPGSRLGEGFWALSGTLLFIHTYDPLTLFYGFGFNERFDERFSGFVVDPGGQYLYQAGLGFAVNSRVTLSAAFTGLYIAEDHIDRVRVEGSILEPMQLRFAATVARPGRIIEPYVELGITRDAPSANVGIIWTF